MDIAFKGLFECFRMISGRLPVLAFHRVVPTPDPLRDFDLDAGAFKRQMEWVASVFRVIPLADAVRLLPGGKLPSRALCLTFDDGYRDNLDVAVPILQELGLHATFFLTTAYQDGGMMWNDLLIESLLRWPGTEVDLRNVGLGVMEWRSPQARRRMLPEIIQHFKYLPVETRESEARELYSAAGLLPLSLMMTTEGIAKLHKAGMGVGGHTHSHPILTRLSVKDSRMEIEENKARLEDVIGERVTIFAYPNGKPGLDFTAVHVKQVREAGYKAAFTSAPGLGDRDTDILQLPRFTPWDRTKGRYILRLAQNYFRSGAVVSASGPEVRF